MQRLPKERFASYRQSSPIPTGSNSRRATSTPRQDPMYVLHGFFRRLRPTGGIILPCAIIASTATRRGVWGTSSRTSPLDRTARSLEDSVDEERRPGPAPLQRDPLPVIPRWSPPAARRRRSSRRSCVGAAILWDMSATCSQTFPCSVAYPRFCLRVVLWNSALSLRSCAARNVARNGTPAPCTPTCPSHAGTGIS